MTIQEFVQSNYDQAVAELAKIKKSPLLKQLQKGPSAYNTDKLVYELSKYDFNPDNVQVNATVIPAGSVIINEAELAALREQVHQSMQTAAQNAPQEEQKPGLIGRIFGAGKQEITDEVLKSLHSQRVAAWKEASFLHTHLADANLSVEEAREKCIRILDLTNEVIPGLDAKEEYYKANGKLPEEATIEDEPTEGEYAELSAMDLFKRIETLKKNIGRDKTARPHKVPQWEAELAVRIEQRKAYEDGAAK